MSNCTLKKEKKQLQQIWAYKEIPKLQLSRKKMTHFSSKGDGDLRADHHLNDGNEVEGKR